MRKKINFTKLFLNNYFNPVTVAWNVNKAQSERQLVHKIRYVFINCNKFHQNCFLI